MSVARVVYRVRQFWLALTSAPDEIQLQEARRVLSPALMSLFLRMTPDEQAHALRVLQTLRSQGHTHPDLLQAALLHDAGKAAQPPLRLWERVLIVIGKALWEDALARWGDAPPKGWRRPFVIAAQHPLWGAQMAQQAGASPQVVALIREHQQPRPHPPETPFEHLLHHLQMADDAN